MKREWPSFFPFFGNIVPRAHVPSGQHQDTCPKGTWALGTRLLSSARPNLRMLRTLT